MLRTAPSSPSRRNVTVPIRDRQVKLISLEFQVMNLFPFEAESLYYGVDLLVGRDTLKDPSHGLELFVGLARDFVNAYS